MDRFRKLILPIAIGLFSFFSLSAQATFPSPNCWECGVGGGAEVLYWRPNVCNTFVAIYGVGETETVVGIKPDYDWGVRGHLSFSRNCFLAHGSYLWLETNDGFKMSSPEEPLLLAPGLTIFVETLRPILRFRYQAADLRLGQILRNKRGCRMAAYGNGRWLDMTRIQQSSATSFGPPGVFRIHQHSTFQGGSLGVGLMADFAVWDGVNVFGDLGASACYGRQRLIALSSATEEPDNDGRLTTSRCCLLPAANFRIGFNYSWDCLCTTIVFEGGYELQHFWNLLTYTPTDTPDILFGGQTIVQGGRRTCIDLGFGGPFAGIRALF